MPSELRNALTCGVVAYAGLVGLYVVLVVASSAVAGELTRIRWPTATYALAGACVFLVAGWCGASGAPVSAPLAVAAAPVAAVLTVGLVGLVVDSLTGPVPPGFLAYFLAGTFVLGGIVSLAGYGVGSWIAGG